jgi:hypothetical protein
VEEISQRFSKVMEIVISLKRDLISYTAEWQGNYVAAKRLNDSNQLREFMKEVDALK